MSPDGTEEKTVNLEIAKYLQDYLIAQDYTVFLTRDTDRGLYDDNECGFLSNPEETARLTDSNYQKQLAYAIAIGVCQFINSQ